MSSFAVIDVPSNLGLRSLGVEQLPVALKAAGLMTAIDAHYAGRIEIPTHDGVRDPETTILHLAGARTVAQRLADVLEDVLDAGNFPLVLGGDCSIELGTMLALRRRGCDGLFFLDGHADFYAPETEPTGEIASMDLALVTGRGPDALTNINDLKPYVRDEDVVVFGFRDVAEYLQEGSPDVRATGIHCYEIDTIRQLGVEGATAEALEQLGLFWVHLDADVLDDRDMPAVDYRLPKPGLRLYELTEILQIISASDRAIGMSITILNPLLDVDGAITQSFVKAVVAGIAPSARVAT